MSEKPWYYGVKWSIGSVDGWGLEYDPDEEEAFYGTTSISVHHDGEFIAAVGIASLHRDDLLDQRAALIAAAPETATERDRLAAENERLREVIMRIADISGVGQSLKYDDAVFTIGRIHSIAMASIPEVSQ